ncbi:hypothetical protein JKP88DRAFT_283644 [Tribonema minus]|uniref:CHCH domain-containing protein n=1 Tax=Tribonema minus TaxID=303371 RepID=A0A836C848_9STRA|nr:hypothetical protein JKP88DRAFT_283644 [Tribonema minus]
MVYIVWRSGDEKGDVAVAKARTPACMDLGKRSYKCMEDSKSQGDKNACTTFLKQYQQCRQAHRSPARLPSLQPLS